VLAGGGNNGGGGLCAARHLHDRGRDVEIVVATDAPGAAAAHHLRTLAATGIEPQAEPSDRPVVVDALVGYGLDGPLRGRAAELAASTVGRTVVSLDFPSGHGFAGGVEARATLTLALPKEGLRGIQPLYLADLGLPPELWAWPTLGLDVGPVFAGGRIVQIV
jgi:NAD(P)H-hydrate epimerase